MSEPAIVVPDSRPVQSDPILAEFYDNTRSLRQVEIDFLIKRNGIPPLALTRDPGAWGFVIGAASVTIDNELFDFAQRGDNRGEAALIFVARDRGGDPLDLVAWAPRSRRLAALFGRAAILGEQRLYAPRIAGVPAVHRSPLDWLRAERDGIVIVRPSRAARVLLDAPGRLLAADKAHANELAVLLSASVDLKRIVIANPAAATA